MRSVMNLWCRSAWRHMRRILFPTPRSNAWLPTLPSSTFRFKFIYTKLKRKFRKASQLIRYVRSNVWSAQDSLGPALIAVHAVHLEPYEITSLARHGCSVAHCPSSNLKLASGVAPVSALLREGINVGLGTDGAASNNRLDLLTEMRHAALLAKVASADPTALPAHEALHLATLAGAKALGLEERIGSLVPRQARRHHRD